VSIISEIAAAVNRFKNHPENLVDVRHQNYRSGDYLVINNCFLYRQDVKTIKASQYLALKATATGTLGTTVYVITGAIFNLSYKTFTSEQISNLNLEVSRLGPSVQMQRRTLGSLVMCLIGTVQDSIVTETKIQNSFLKCLKLDPRSPNPVSCHPPVLTVRAANNESVVWTEVSTYVQQHAPSENQLKLRAAIAKALDTALSTASAKLAIPVRGSVSTTGLTDELASTLDGQISEYRTALASFHAGTNAVVPNEVLRLAYNFATESEKFIRLIISVCDLKPIVFWLTIDKHYQLFRALEALPWMSHVKPSLKDYCYMISGARNTAFHQFFPVSKTLVAELPPDIFSHASAQLFPEFTSKNKPRLDYRDKELLDVLMEFTRTKDRQISRDFWSLNVDVMEASLELFRATSNVLKLLNA